MKAETLGRACVRAQREYAKGRGKPGDRERAERRRQLFAQAIRRDVSYRRLASLVGLSVSTVSTLVGSADTRRNQRPDPLSEPVWAEHEPT